MVLVVTRACQWRAVLVAIDAGLGRRSGWVGVTLAHDAAGGTETTALGGLYHHITRPRGPGEAFSPTNINFGLLPPIEVRAKKRDRKRLIAERAARDLTPWVDQVRIDRGPADLGIVAS